jgi:hypothetical protein
MYTAWAGGGGGISQKVIDWQNSFNTLIFYPTIQLKIHKLSKNGKNHLTYSLNNCFERMCLSPYLSTGTLSKIIYALKKKCSLRMQILYLGNKHYPA